MAHHCLKGMGKRDEKKRKRKDWISKHAIHSPFLISVFVFKPSHGADKSHGHTIASSTASEGSREAKCGGERTGSVGRRSGKRRLPSFEDVCCVSSSAPLIGKSHVGPSTVQNPDKAPLQPCSRLVSRLPAFHSHSVLPLTTWARFFILAPRCAQERERERERKRKEGKSARLCVCVD